MPPRTRSAVDTGKGAPAILQRVVALAGKQHGTFTTEQALGLGMRRWTLDRLVDEGIFVRECRGGYRVAGAELGALQRYQLAVTPCDDELLQGFLDHCIGWADFAWEPARVVLELDGYAYHSSYRAFVADRERANRLSAAGWEMVRAASEQVRSNPAGVCSAIAAALGRAASRRRTA